MKTFQILIGLGALFSISLSQRLAPFISQGQPQPGHFNALCLASSQCDQKQGLYCVPPPNGPGNQPRCRCPTNTTFFDDSRQRCVGLIGQNCAHQGNTTYCPSNAHCSHQDPRNPSLYFYETKCFCDPNFIPTPEGTCAPAARFNEPCNHSDRRCDILLGMKCNPEEKTCGCEFDDQFLDKSGKCVSFINKKCSTYHGCVENARCDGLAPAKARTYVSPSQARKPASSDNAVIQQNNKQIQPQYSQDGRLVGKCVCEYGFSPANNGRCMASYRFACSALSPCNPLDNLQCQDGSCSCKYPLHMYWDHKLRKCRVLVGGKCGQTGNGEECVDNAYCSDGYCKCKQDFIRTPHRKCLRSFLSNCKNETCDFYRGLTCMEEISQSVCRCFDESLVYNENLGCVSQKNLPCGKIGPAGDYGKEPYHVACEPPAVCKPEVVGDLTTSFCRV